MIRRRMVVLAAAATLLAGLVLSLIAMVLLTRTNFGRAQIRSFVVGRLKSAVHGKLYLGALHGSILSDVLIDSLELRDEQDSLFFASGPVAVKFDIRDLMDLRIVLHDLRLTNPVVNLNTDSAGVLNFRKIFPPDTSHRPARTTPGWGDYVEMAEARLEKLTVQVTLPWHPDSTLAGARRDSAITAALKREDKVIRRVGSRYVQTLRWENGNVYLTKGRLDDRAIGGRFLEIKDLALVGYAPPLNVRNLTGTVRMQGDSLWLDLPRFDLPASTGSAKGKVSWGGPYTRYDVAFIGDSVSLNDVAWVYPTLPKTGGGKMNMLMRSQSNPAIVDYVLTDMDVRSTDSWLRGKMTFAVGGPITVVKDVDLVAQPMDFRLIETLSGSPLPYPFRGTLSGSVKARGGPLDRFVVDAADIIYRDANVAGATTVGSGHGELNILEPSNTSFHAFDLRMDQLDLRTVQFLNPGFPRLDGLIAGRLTLDSTLTDLRFRNAELTHSDGSGPVSHVTGAGRVTFGDQYTTYDVALNALPLSFTTLHTAYKDGRIPFHGEYSGPLRLQGTLQDLDISTDLRGPSGTVAFDGRVDADSVGGYGAHGTLRFANLDLRTFLDTVLTPPTVLTGQADLDVAGDSLATLVGSATLELERSLYDSVRIYPSRTRLRFADRRLAVDTLDLQSVIATVSAKGGLGLAPNARDSLAFTVLADSLGGLRRYLQKPGTASTDGDSTVATVDSLRGRVKGGGVFYGSVDTLGVRAALDARGVDAVQTTAKVVRLNATFDDVSTRPHGVAHLTVDTLATSGIVLNSAGVDLTLADPSSGEFSLLASARNGPVVKSAGNLAFSGDTTVALLKSLAVSMQEHQLSLTRETAIRVEPRRLAFDTLRLAGVRGEQLILAADLPREGEIHALFRADSVHLADLAELAQLPLSLGGTLTGGVTVSGVREAPIMVMSAAVTGAKVGEVSVARMAADARYADKRLRGTLQVTQQDTTVMDVSANVPLDLAFASRTNRLLPDTMRVSIRSNNVDLRLVESFTPKVTNASGRFTANLDLSGPSRSALLSGKMTVSDGAASLPEAGIRLRSIRADVTARNDTLFLQPISALSGPGAENLMSITGSVARPLHNDASFDLEFQARQFHMIGNRQLADLYISFSPPLRFTGSSISDVLTGRIIVDRGEVYMPESSDKQLVALESEDLAGLDTAAAGRSGLLPKPPPRLVQNLQVRDVEVVMGPNVWLRSAHSRDVNIKLGGSVRVTASGLRTSRPDKLSLQGSLQAERGTYNLNLGAFLQKTFTIEGGELRFYEGDEALNPAMNVSALYVARQVSSTYGGRNDVRIRANITGTLLQPKLALESADSLNLSSSDLFSYLMFGTPSFDVGGGVRPQLSALLIGSQINALASRLSGGFFDYVQVQTAADQLHVNNANALIGAQLGFGKQINSRLFGSLSTGVCQLSSRSQRIDAASLASSIGLRLEYQIKRDLGLAVGVEPSLSALLCTQGLERGFTTSAPHFGGDLFKNIRW